MNQLPRDLPQTETPPRRTLAAGARIWRKVDRGIVLIHRWVGILTCLACLVWCLSGIALIYIVQPKLSEAEARAALEPIRWEQVKTDPTAAMTAARLDAFPRRLRLEMSGGRPVYFLTAQDGSLGAVSATDGRPLGGIDQDQALRIGQAFGHGARPTYLRRVERDRWTFKAGSDGYDFDRTRPFHLIALNDAEGRQIYVSARTGAVVMETSSHDRFWSWFARVPHTIDLPFIRPHTLAWRRFILWSTALAAVVLAGGLWLGVARLSLVKRYGEGRISPFRGFMLWHHLLGLTGGVTLFVWICTAWIFMHPGQLLAATSTSARSLKAYAAHDDADFPSPADLTAMAPPAAVSAGFSWVAGRPIIAFSTVDRRTTAADGGNGTPLNLSDAQLLDAARVLAPGARVVLAERRTTTDRYWHSFKGISRKLPVYRVVFADAQGTWAHLDPATGEVLQTMRHSDRTYSLFFNEIHKVDVFGFGEPLRKVVMWILLLLASGISLTGVIVGWMHLTRGRPMKPARP